MKMQQASVECDADPDWDKADRLMAEGVDDGWFTPSQVEASGEKLRNLISEQFLIFCDENGVSELKRRRGIKKIAELDVFALAVKQMCFALRHAQENGGNNATDPL